LEKEHDIHEVVREFDWVIKNLNSVKTKEQLHSIENLFESWRNKYSCNRLQNIITDFQFYFEKKLERKEQKICKI
jgi:hypothetical protein